MMDDLIYATAALSAAVSCQDGGGMQSILDKSLPQRSIPPVNDLKWYRLRLPLSWVELNPPETSCWVFHFELCEDGSSIVGNGNVANVHEHLVEADGAEEDLTMFATAMAAVTFPIRTSSPGFALASRTVNGDMNE
jgi:hypothetical protein